MQKAQPTLKLKLILLRTLREGNQTVVTVANLLF